MNSESYDQSRFEGPFRKPTRWAIKALQAGGTKYNFVLQQDRGEKVPMICAGCRYMTLAQAKRHWGSGEHYRGKNTCSAILLQIASLVAIARGNGWTKAKFDPTIKKAPKKKSAVRKAKRAVKKTTRRRR